MRRDERRAAVEAKRAIPDFPPVFTEAELLGADRARNAAKADGSLAQLEADVAQRNEDFLHRIRCGGL